MKQKKNEVQFRHIKVGEKFSFFEGDKLVFKKINLGQAVALHDPDFPIDLPLARVLIFLDDEALAIPRKAAQ